MTKKIIVIFFFFLASIISAQENITIKKEVNCGNPMILKKNIDDYEGDYEFQKFRYNQNEISLIRYSNVNLIELFSKILNVPEENIQLETSKKENKKYFKEKITILLNCGDIDEAKAKKNLLDAIIIAFELKLINYN